MTFRFIILSILQFHKFIYEHTPKNCIKLDFDVFTNGNCKHENKFVRSFVNSIINILNIMPVIQRKCMIHAIHLYEKYCLENRQVNYYH